MDIIWNDDIVMWWYIQFKNVISVCNELCSPCHRQRSLAYSNGWYLKRWLVMWWYIKYNDLPNKQCTQIKSEGMHL